MAKGIAYIEFVEKYVDLISKIRGFEKDNAYAKTIIQDLLDNSDEYARQRAMDFLKEGK